jgi:hypothetical protein
VGSGEGEEIRTSIGYGNGGWVRVERDGLPGLLYLRFAQAAGRWQVCEMYLECGEGEEIRAWDLRKLPLAAISALALSHGGHLAARAALPGPDLATLASNYATTFGSRAGHWVAESMRDPAANRKLRKRPPRAAESPRVPPLDRPDRIDDTFLRHVADAYADAIEHGAKSPGAALARRAMVPVRTVHRWIYLARKAGHLPPGSQGRIG